MKKDILKVQNLNYKNILKNINLTIQKGAKIGIVGSSGSGKTTFLKALNNLVRADGDIFLGGVSIYTLNPSELRQRIGLIFQEPALFESTVKKELIWPLKLKNSKKNKLADKKLNEILELCRLDVPLDTITVKFSGGEKQRLAIARTLILEPEIFLMDEPTSSLDIKLSRNIIDNILLKYSNMTFIIVSHAFDLIKKMDRILLFEGGRIKEEYSPKEIKSIEGYFNAESD